MVQLGARMTTYRYTYTLYPDDDWIEATDRTTGTRHLQCAAHSRAGMVKDVTLVEVTG